MYTTIAAVLLALYTIIAPFVAYRFGCYRTEVQNLRKNQFNGRHSNSDIGIIEDAMANLVNQMTNLKAGVSVLETITDGLDRANDRARELLAELRGLPVSYENHDH